MLQNWLTASTSQREEILRACFESAKAQFSLDGLSLSFQMPTGYEDANGTYDITVNTLFLNPAFLSLPYELDANRFAYDTLLAEFPEQTCELGKLLAFWTPKHPVSPTELSRLFQSIDAGLRSV